MRKTFLGMLGAGLALVLVAQGCGDSDPVPPPLLPDGGAWVDCDEQDAGNCAPGQSCRFVEAFERSLCVSPCELATGCGNSEVLCCPSGEGAGTGGYCLPKDACTPPDAGTPDAGGGLDAGGDGQDGGPGPVLDGGPGPGTDAGPAQDAGIDAGPAQDAGIDAGPAQDAGIDAGIDGGPAQDAGSPDSGVDAGVDAGTPDAGSARIRLMAANVSSGNYQAYEAPGIRLMQGVKPDVVMIQEFNYRSGSISDLVNTTFPGFYYYQEAGAQIPNGVISRWPILASGEWDDPEVDNRDFAWARIDIPGPKDLWVVSVHLLTRNASTRNTEAISLVAKIKANIPAGDYLAIGGDFNTDSRSESCFSTFSQVVTTTGPHPADKNGTEGTNASRGKPYDHVLVDADLRAYQTATVIGTSSFANGLVLDSRVYTPLSEIAPVQSGDSAASNMQHMGVIKDFLVPLN
ncbi:endonuclease/exonuclease/phosphatase family protein [Stigmatella sp. ncwal1]|uniref:Endonuclease/exonuclease/phosphatase family protein n=1 Tax=Stigmatella ashevillensis TaxID=2995309 RepID=A0ABT5DEA3_9BACT|nr:endonuclease/exonuclease/phosphatase family protein [Stigmatella ashevillena]MDC0711448.1 endonuclease/exonuclease/phosphatase family protein [Stigmatella ashevillena]